MRSLCSPAQHSCFQRAATSTDTAPDDSPSGSTTGALRIGTLFPQTGTLAHLILGPRAAVKVAMEEINAAGGVLGQDIELVVEGNEHDASDPTIMNKSIDEIVKVAPAFVLGAMGTGNSNAAMPRITEAGILMGSPSNTGIAMSGINDAVLPYDCLRHDPGSRAWQPRAQGRQQERRDARAEQ